MPWSRGKGSCSVIAFHIQGRDDTQRGSRSQNTESSASPGCIGWEERLYARLTSITHSKISVTLSLR